MEDDDCREDDIDNMYGVCIRKAGITLQLYEVQNKLAPHNLIEI